MVTRTGLPADARAQLDDALATLGLVLDETQCERLLAHLVLLLKWNAVYNLTAVREPAQMLVQHLFDCLAVLPALRDPGRAGADRLAPGAVVIDVGSGGGLPGVVIAIGAPQVRVHCVDAVAKKAAFIRQVGAELGLANLHSHHGRIEQLGPPALPAADLIISRAFASLADFVNLSAPALAPHGMWAAMKGALPEDELRALPPTVRMSAAITLAVPRLEARRHLLLLEPVGPV